jgi:hypothetical protein
MHAWHGSLKAKPRRHYPTGFEGTRCAITYPRQLRRQNALALQFFNELRSQVLLGEQAVKYAMVLAKPSLSGTRGFQFSSSCASEMSYHSRAAHDARCASEIRPD